MSCPSRSARHACNRPSPPRGRGDTARRLRTGMDEDFRKAALDYHRLPRPGKLSVEPTKRMASQRDLALAYSPGVAAACEAIAADPDSGARLYRARQSRRGGLERHRGARPRQYRAARGQAGDGGQGGALQEVRRTSTCSTSRSTAIDPDRFVDVVAALEPTFGGINLEDIKAPECFEIEQRLRERMNIPVFHDDQHGTAIVCAAAITNGLRLQGKTPCQISSSSPRAQARLRCRASICWSAWDCRSRT